MTTPGIWDSGASCVIRDDTVDVHMLMKKSVSLTWTGVRIAIAHPIAHPLTIVIDDASGGRRLRFRIWSVDAGIIKFVLIVECFVEVALDSCEQISFHMLHTSSVPRCGVGGRIGWI
jgi:hypothetical protein